MRRAGGGGVSFNASHWNDHDPSLSSVWRSETEAQNGSEALRQAMNAQFRMFALKHGVTLEDAKLFCMNGEEPR